MFFRRACCCLFLSRNIQISPTCYLPSFRSYQLSPCKTSLASLWVMIKCFSLLTWHFANTGHLLFWCGASQPNNMCIVWSYLKQNIFHIAPSWSVGHFKCLHTVNKEKLVGLKVSFFSTQFSSSFLESEIGNWKSRRSDGQFTTICFQMSDQKYLENYATPMGTVPISVIYGFEYPCGEMARNAITRRRRNPPGVERPLPLSLPRKTRGCLSDLKQYRRARLVSGRQASLARLPRGRSLAQVCPGPPARSVHKYQNMAEVRSWYWRSGQVRSCYWSSRSVHWK